jgi:hypothetical protein
MDSFIQNAQHHPWIRRSLFAALLFVSAAVVFGQPGPPTLPSPVSGFTIDRLNQLAVSGTPYYSTLRAFAQHGNASSNATTQDLNGPAGSTHRPGLLTGSATFRPAVNTVDGNLNMTTDTVKDIEPSTIVQQVGSTIYSTVAVTKYTDPSFPRLWTYTATNLGMPPSSFQLPTPQAGDGWLGNLADYRLTFDPYLAANHYAQNPGSKRVYVSGAAFSGTIYTQPSGVAVWRSDDGGLTFSNPKPVVSTNQNNIFYDKPHIAVSQYAGTRGYVYVAYTRVVNGGSSEVHVARSMDGGLSFNQDTIVATGVQLNMPQILVDNTYGYLYCLWMQFPNLSNNFTSRIVVRSSSTDGASWNPESAITSSASDPPGTGSRLIPPPGARAPNNTRMPSVIVARYNPMARRITLTWSAIGGDESVDIFVATKGAGYPWIINAVSGVTMTNDQFEPAIDSDGSGNNLISYYSRAADLNNANYRGYTVMLDATGSSLVRGEEEICTPECLETDPAVTGSTIPGFVGDYHDVWFSSEYYEWHSSWIRRQSPTNTSYDAWLARIH